MKPLHGVLLLLAAAPSATRADDYSGMLAYLDVARIDGHALAGANGAIAVNQAAGDLNVQANLRGIAKGDRADVATNARQLQQGNRVLSGPLRATAFIGGDALAGASGIASINQASGIANTTLNVVSATLARQGIRETDDTALAAEGSALAGGAGRHRSRRRDGHPQRRCSQHRAAGIRRGPATQSDRGQRQRHGQRTGPGRAGPPVTTTQPMHHLMRERAP
nr:hypothetical protein [Stenotrophomonas maltophilia]